MASRSMRDRFTMWVDLRANVKGLQAGFATAAASTRAFSTQMQGITAGGAGNMAALFGSAKAMTVAAAATTLASVAGISLKTFTQIEKGWTEVTTLMVRRNKEFTDSLYEDMRKLALRTAQDIGTLVNAAYQSISAGVTDTDLIAFLEAANLAARAGVTDISTAVDGLTNILNAYNLEAKHALAVSDAMFTSVRLGKLTFDQLTEAVGRVSGLAQSSALQIEEMTLAIAAMTTRGITASEAATRLRSILNDFATESSKSSKFVRENWGTTFTGLVQQTGGFMEALQLVVERADEEGIALEELFGRVEASLGAIDLTSQRSLEVFEEGMGGAAGATEKAAEKMIGTFAYWMERIRAYMNEAKLVIGENIAAVINYFRNAENEGAKEFVGSLKEALGAYKEFLQQVWTTLRALFENPIIQGALKIAIQGLKDFYLKMQETLRLIQGAIETVTAAIKGDWAGAWAAIKETAEDFWDLFKRRLQGQLDTFVEVFETPIEYIVRSFIWLWDQVADFTATGVQAFLDGIAIVVNETIGGLHAALVEIKNLLNKIPGASTILGGDWEHGDHWKWDAPDVEASIRSTKLSSGWGEDGAWEMPDWGGAIWSEFPQYRASISWEDYENWYLENNVPLPWNEGRQVKTTPQSLVERIPGIIEHLSRRVTQGTMDPDLAARLLEDIQRQAGLDRYSDLGHRLWQAIQGFRTQTTDTGSGIDDPWADYREAWRVEDLAYKQGDITAPSYLDVLRNRIELVGGGSYDRGRYSEIGSGFWSTYSQVHQEYYGQFSTLEEQQDADYDLGLISHQEYYDILHQRYLAAGGYQTDAGLAIRSRMQQVATQIGVNDLSLEEEQDHQYRMGEIDVHQYRDILQSRFEAAGGRTTREGLALETKIQSLDREIESLDPYKSYRGQWDKEDLKYQYGEIGDRHYMALLEARIAMVGGRYTEDGRQFYTTLTQIRNRLSGEETSPEELEDHYFETGIYTKQDYLEILQRRFEDAGYEGTDIGRGIALQIRDLEEQIRQDDITAQNLLTSPEEELDYLYSTGQLTHDQMLKELHRRAQAAGGLTTDAGRAIHQQIFQIERTMEREATQREREALQYQEQYTSEPELQDHLYQIGELSPQNYLGILQRRFQAVGGRTTDAGRAIELQMVRVREAIEKQTKDLIKDREDRALIVQFDANLDEGVVIRRQEVGWARRRNIAQRGDTVLPARRAIA